MKKIIFLCIISGISISFAQVSSRQKIAVQEVRFDSARTNHLGKKWGFWFGSNDTTFIMLLPDSESFYALGHRAMKIDTGQVSVLNALVVGPGGSIVLPPVNFGVRRIIAGIGIKISPIDGLGEVTVTSDTAALGAIFLHRSDSTLYLTKILWADSLSKLVRLRDTILVFYSIARSRDSLAAARARYVWKSDSGSTYASFASFRDSIAQMIKKRDSTGSSASYATWARMRDSLAAAYARNLRSLDSGSVWVSFAAFRDSIAKALARYVWKPDSGSTYASFPAFRDSLAAERTRSLKKNDSTAATGFPSINRMLDSLSDIRTSMNSIVDSTKFATVNRMLDSLNHVRTSMNSIGAPDSTKFATVNRMLDSLNQARLRNLVKADSGISFASFAAFRDSLAQHRLKLLAKADSGIAYASFPAFRDSLAAERARSLKKADSIAAGGFPTINRVLDSLSDIRSSMNSIGGGAHPDSVKYKTADQTNTSYTTLVDDAYLKFGIAANQVWVGEIELLIRASSPGSESEPFNGTAAIYTQFTVPSGTTGWYELSNFYSNTYAPGAFYYSVLATAFGSANFTSLSQANNSYPDVTAILHVRFYFKASSTPGTIQFKWRAWEGTDNNCTMTVYTGSWLWTRKAN